MKVLLVDDTRTNLSVLRAMLEAEKFDVAEAADGVEALDVLENESIDAIISDILMPRMDGYRLCYEVRKSERFCFLPFIFYTATYTSPSDEKLCYSLGGDKYLLKPASAKAVLTALRESVNMDRRARPSLVTAASDAGVMREYSDRLVSKLEDKNVELARRTEQLERAGVELRRANTELDLRVRQRTMELEASNLEFEAFTYSVSHDLRAPLRHIDGFAKLILKSGAAQLDETNLKHLNIICNSTQKMAGLIDGLLELSKASRAKVHWRPIDFSALARDVMVELQQSQPDRVVQIDIAPGLSAQGDQRLLYGALMNLLGNAWKFTSHRPNARIEFGRNHNEIDSPYFVRDNGAGFDMEYVGKLFCAFQRLHRMDEFEGSGIGLATVKRIIQKHGGRIWAESVLNQGSVFYFTLEEKSPIQTEHAVCPAEEAE
ncbi:MAG TPA: response regulator [Verrucomicrobiae bacterium]|nr:response regulator [Verrucomicrobiae bacterium]